MDLNRGVKEQNEARAFTATTSVAEDVCNRQGSGGPVPAGSQSHGSDKLPRVAGGIVALALNSEDMKIVTCALNMLRPLLPLDPSQEDVLEKRLSALIASGSAAKNPDLAEAVTHFLYRRGQQRASAVVPFIPALLSFLDQDLATTGAHSYYTLMILAEDAPDDLLPFADVLIGKMASPSYAVRALAVRIIAALADKRPGSMTNAREPLCDLVDNSGEGILKIEASKALQSIEGRLKSSEGDGAIAGWTATVANSHRPAGYAWFQAILARLMNLLRVISRSGGNLKAKSLIADDLQGITWWIEAEFPVNGDVPFVENAWTLPEEPVRFFPSKINTKAVWERCIMPSWVTPDVLVIAKQQSPEMARPVNDNDPRAIFFADEAEMALMREAIEKVGNDFSVKASRILDGLGMEYLEPAVKGVAEDRMISARELKLAREKILDVQEGITPATRFVPGSGDARSSGPEAKRLLKEIRRNIDDSLTMANEPVKNIAISFLKPAESRGVVDITRPSTVSYPAKKRASANVHVRKRAGKMYRYYDRYN